MNGRIVILKFMGLHVVFMGVKEAKRLSVLQVIGL